MGKETAKNKQQENRGFRKRQIHASERDRRGTQRRSHKTPMAHGTLGSAGKMTRA